MKLLTRDRSTTRTLQDRLVWQCASLLLAYPDEQSADRLDTVERLLAHIRGPAAGMLQRTVDALRGGDPLRAAADYVETFDLRRRSTMYLTYWTAGDTRNRGSQMLAFAAAYRDAGVEPPRGEAPDHLPVVLEFAATVDPVAGRRLLTEHRVPIDVLREALAEATVTVRARRRRGVRDAAGRHRLRDAAGTAAGAGRTADGIGWAATVYVDGAASAGRRRAMRCWVRSSGTSSRT